MKSEADIQIVCVPPHMLGEMWLHIGPLLLQGQLEIHGNLREAMKALSIHLLQAQDGAAQFWTVIDETEKRVVAVMISEIIEDGDERVVWVTGMAGDHILRWGKPMSDRMAQFAKDEGCKCFRFCGRPALKRAYRDVHCIGIENDADDVFIYERAV